MSLNRRKILSIIGIFILGAMIGGIIGVYGKLHFLGSYFASASNSSHITAITDKVFALSKLHEGQTEKAAEHLEKALDGDLIYFSVGIHGSDKVRKEIRTALKSAREYRSQFPRSTNHPELDKAVARALAEAAE